VHEVRPLHDRGRPEESELTITGAPYLTIPAGNVSVSGWLQSQARRALDGYIGAMPALSVEVGGDVFATGRLGPDSPAAGTNIAGVGWWNGESEGNWLLAWVTHALLLQDATAIAAVRAYLGRIVDCQGDDGYIGMFTGAARAQQPFIGGDLWTQSRVLQALQVWVEHTGDEAISAAISAALDHCANRFRQAQEQGEAFAPHTGDSCGRGHDLMIVEVAAEQFGRTSDPALLEFASAVYDGFSQADLSWPDADGQLGQLLSDSPVIGHGAHTAEYLRIPLLLADLNSDGRLRAAFDNGYQKVTRALGVAGGLKSDETISAPGGHPVPLPESGYEFCAITELAISFLEAARITGDFEYLDRVETLFLNIAQAGIALDGRSVAYFVAENQPSGTHLMGARWDYSPTHDDAAVCCVPNAGRILPIVAKRMVMQSAAGISVQLYGPMQTSLATADGPITVRQETQFPFDEQVIIHLGADGLVFEVELRIPRWCASPAVRVVGASGLRQERLGDRVRLTATWGPRSEIHLRLPQELRTLPTVDGRTALAVGPLLYSVPIDHVTSAHREYGVDGYADLDLVPSSPGSMHPPVLLADRLAQARVTLAQPSGPDPWVGPGFELTVPGINPNPRHGALEGGGESTIRLVPLGSTSLRWTALTTAT